MLRLALSLLLLSTLALRGHEPRMSWLDDGAIRLGVDLELGGAITWLSRSGSGENAINSKDWGRQVQMSFYAGPVPFFAGAKHPARFWEGLGWNPIQAGDDFGHRSRVLETRNDGRQLYVKCVPMQWPLDDVPGECVFESWLELEGATVKARGRLVNARTDHAQYPARTQELPAIYTNGSFHRLLTYNGEHPFTGEPVAEIPPQGPPRWTQWMATEGWSALVDEHGFGLGVISPSCLQHKGGFNGKPGAGAPADDACGYLAPLRAEILDHDIAYDFEYRLVLGTVEEIRAQAQPPGPPRWSFKKDREGWTYQHAGDAGWPVTDELSVRWHEEDPALISPLFLARAGEAPSVTVEAAFRGSEGRAELFWSTLAEPGFSGLRSASFPVVRDGQLHAYEVALPAAAGQPLTQLRLDPASGGEGEVRVRLIEFHPR